MVDFNPASHALLQITDFKIGQGSQLLCGISKITDLPLPDDGLGAGNRFMKEFCTVKENSVGRAFSFDGKAVYVGRVTKRTDSEPQAFDDESDRDPTFLSPEPRETANFFGLWLDEFRKDHDWDGQVLELPR